MSFSTFHKYFLQQHITDGGAHVFSLSTNADRLDGSAQTYTTNQIYGFTVEVAGTGDWTATFAGGNTVTFTPTAGKDYGWHLTSLTTPADATCKAVVYI